MGLMATLALAGLAVYTALPHLRLLPTLLTLGVPALGGFARGRPLVRLGLRTLAAPTEQWEEVVAEREGCSCRPARDQRSAWRGERRHGRPRHGGRGGHNGGRECGLVGFGRDGGRPVR